MNDFNILPYHTFSGLCLSSSDTSRKCLSLAYNLPQLCRFWGRFWVLCTLRLSFTLLALAPATLYLSACGTSDSLQIQTQSQLHDVSNTEHTFRLAPVDRSQYENYSLIGDEKGDPNAIMRFEMCLNDASANPMPQTCVNAFRNDHGEPIFFTIDAVSKAALTPEELSYVSGLERSWESFRRASKRLSEEKKMLVIGAAVGTTTTGLSTWISGARASSIVSKLDSIDKELAYEIDEVLEDFGVSDLDEVPGARKTLGSEVSPRQIYDEDFLAIIARKAQPFLEAQNVDLNTALSFPMNYLKDYNAPGVVEESLEEFMKLAPDQNISHIVKPQYQKHFLEYVSAMQYFWGFLSSEIRMLWWVPLTGDATSRLGQMNEFFNKYVKHNPFSMDIFKPAPTWTILQNVKEFVDYRGQVPLLSEARLAIRAYQRGGLKALSTVSEDVVDGLRLLHVDGLQRLSNSGPLTKRLRGLYRRLFAMRSLGLVAISVGVLGTGMIAVLGGFESQILRPNDDDNPDLVPKEGLGDLGITPGNIDTFTIIADLGSAITSNEENVGVESAESVVRHVARYLERIGFSHSDTSIAYVCLPKQVIAQEIGGYSAYDRGLFFRKCYEN